MAPATTNLVALNMDWNLHLGDEVVVMVVKIAAASTARTGPARRTNSPATWRSKAVMSSIVKVLSQAVEQSLDALARGGW